METKKSQVSSIETESDSFTDAKQISKETQHPTENVKAAETIRISCEGKRLSFVPLENASAEAFVEKLKEGDISVSMHDYGDFEKAGDLGFELPRSDEQITTVPGDVILYQGSSVTIYYDENNWNFTRLGTIPEMNRETMLEFFGGAGEVKVTFSIE